MPGSIAQLIDLCKNDSEYDPIITEDDAYCIIDGCLLIEGYGDPIDSADNRGYADDLKIKIENDSLTLWHREHGTIEWIGPFFCEDFEDLHGFVYCL
jgi:hypothetical protein